jgi:hypothetical protein
MTAHRSAYGTATVAPSGVSTDSAWSRWWPVEDLGSSFGSGLFHAVTVAVGDDDVAVVEEPVEHGDGGGVFGQETPPGFEWPVRADAEGAAFVGGGDEPKQ